MSQNFKTALKYWFWLIVGIFLISIQVYKYFTNTLEFTTKEIIFTNEFGHDTQVCRIEDLVELDLELTEEAEKLIKGE